MPSSHCVDTQIYYVPPALVAKKAVMEQLKSKPGFQDGSEIAEDWLVDDRDGNLV
jgi:hypothetical protein